MNARITLIATEGPLKGQKFTIAGRVIGTIGRSEDCLLRIRGAAENLTVSRRHCLLIIEPPVVRVRDLGSLNGTFVNGRKIGQREKGTPPLAAVPAEVEGVELHDGDRLSIGSSEFLVGITCASDDGGPAAMAREEQAVEPAGIAACR
jgi:pSer/pThr/pTyr-binding forkhead associated (FHA) protein